MRAVRTLRRGFQATPPWPRVRLRFGLAAWSNRHFDLALYPLRTPHAEYLTRYATRFDCVEADILHHSMPAPDDVREWPAQTPDGFLFLPKMVKTATHGVATESSRLPPDLARRMQRMRARHGLQQPTPAAPPAPARPDDAAAAARTFLEGIAPIRDAGRLGPVLLQFPAWLERHAGWDTLTALLSTAEAGTFAVEFRHTSWFVPAVEQLLEDFDAPLVWSTFPGAFAPPWATASVGYVRFTGKQEKTRGRNVRVDDRLGEALEIGKRLKQAPWKECFVIVTNRFEGNAVDSMPRVAAALAGPEVGQRFDHAPGQVLFPDPPADGASSEPSPARARKHSPSTPTRRPSMHGGRKRAN